jgi:hypothetical protein
MAKRRDLQAGGEGDGVEGVDVSGVYHSVSGATMVQLVAVGDELLRSEGIDPAWVPFTEAEFAEAESLST